MICSGINVSVIPGEFWLQMEEEKVGGVEMFGWMRMQVNTCGNIDLSWVLSESVSSFRG